MSGRMNEDGVRVNRSTGGLMVGTLVCIPVALMCAGLLEITLGSGWSMGALGVWIVAYAAVAWAVVVRDLRRTRPVEGLCLGCGYDRRGLDQGAVCPECGGRQR